MENLSEFSRRFAEFLRTEKLEWHRYAVTLVRDGATAAVVEVTIPGLLPDRPILLATDDDEVTVAFAIWHGHFDDFAEALRCAEEFFDESRKAAGWKLGERWLGATTFLGDTFTDTPSPYLTARPDTLIIRSFRGTYDEDRRLP